MHGEIITIGDELITGRVCDLNSHFLSARLSSYGLKVTAISSVGDHPPSIIGVLGRAVARSDFVIVSGGLGPTEDDITAEMAARFFNKPLLIDESFLDSIRRSLHDRGIAWVESYKKMALLPEGARLIDPEGEACGFYLDHEHVPVFFLPGVPEEVTVLTENKVLPLLLARRSEPGVFRQRLFKVFGLQEAEIGEMLDGMAHDESGVMIGFYPNFPENHVTVTVRAADQTQAASVLNRVEAEVEKRLGSYVIAKDAATLEESVGVLLRSQGRRLAAAESCTGGLICHRLTSVSGASDYFERGLVTYSNKAKQELLGVPAEVIETHGAVSAETAARMAEGVRERSGTDLGLGVTGIAGPTGGTKDKPVGTVFMALAAPEGIGVERFQFTGRRDQIQKMTAQTALDWLHRYLINGQVLFRY